MPTEDNESHRGIYAALNEGHDDMRNDLLLRIAESSPSLPLEKNEASHKSLRIEFAIAIVAVIAVIIFNLTPGGHDPDSAGPLAPAKGNRHVASRPKTPLTHELPSDSGVSDGLESERPTSGVRNSGAVAQNVSGAEPSDRGAFSSGAFSSGSGEKFNPEQKRLATLKAKALTTDVDFEQTPFTHPIFADDASIFVLKGPAVPAQLGAILTDEDLHNARIPGEPNKKLPEQTLHLWNWNESSTSRVTSIPAIHGTTALSPDGTELLHSSGVTVDTQTGNSRKLKGFEVNIGERICKLKFSPAGRYVLAWLLPEAAPKNTQLRIIDITEEKVMAQFAAGWYAAFNPSESVVVYTRPVPNTPRTDAIQRFDLQPQQQAALQSVLAYTPLFEIHEAEQLTTADTTMESVGVTVSPDGKLLAVSYSYGKVFIWELESAKLVSYKRLFRKGKRDKFFAAKQMRFSPDGKLLAMASGSRLKIIQTADGEQIAEHYDRATPQIAHMRWSADSQQIQLLSYSTIKTLRSSGGAESVASEMLPRLYRWNWKTGPPLPTPHISHDEQ